MDCPILYRSIIKHFKRVVFHLPFDPTLPINTSCVTITLWKDELGGVRGLLLLGVQENKQTREEQNNRIRTIARLISVSLAPRS